ncbi:MAG: RagB/SusD family nutrient uptake outer membrane protein [Candidatus Cyclobacteriaceae bacterium M3_2C_046]
MKLLYKISYIILGFVVVAALNSCSEDFLDTEPAEYVSEGQIATSPAANQAIVNGIYAALRTYGAGNTTFHVDYGLMSTLNATEMMGQDVAMSAFHWYGFYHNYSGREATSSRARLQWVTYYTQILAANTVANAIPLDADDAESQHILGQALALRGLFYHNLVRLYAERYAGNEGQPGIPIYDGSTFEGQPRSSIGDVYDRIVIDLENAADLLEGFDRSTKQEINQNVAQGLLARVYLDMERWQDAATMANTAREGLSLMSGQDYLDGFDDIGNSGWMWGSDIDNESSTIFASFFSHFDNTNNGYAGALAVYKLINAGLYDQIPETDLRRQAFVDPVSGSEAYPQLPGYSNIKFRDATFFEGDYVYMRVAEMYLIEAEALARLNDASAANVLSELVSSRNPDYTPPTATGSALVDEVLLQRRIELWGEGFSWFDLKRLNRPVIRDYEGTNHASFGRFNIDAGDPQFTFQIPEDEINANEAIPTLDQNP